MRLLICVLTTVMFAVSTWATEEEAPESHESSSYYQQLKEKYELNDEDYKLLKDSGLNSAQATKAVHMYSLQEGKTFEEVLKMRTEEGKGWGVIAKELGVHPGELGKGHSKMHEKRMDRAEHKQARMEAKAERKANRMAAKSEKMAQKSERKANGKNK